MTTDFTHFDVWNKAMDLAVEVHHITKDFPKEEMYGVTSQMRRSAISVAANIAEGFGRYTYADKMHKYVQARGELIELMTFVHYCHRVEYLSPQEHATLLERCQDVRMMLNALISKMNKLQDKASS
jgi:four helix bundle protein